MPNGFHELASLVAPLDFGDTVRVEVLEGRREVRLSCSDASLPTDEGNLAFAAAMRFLEHYQLDRSVSISLEKRIPHGAGLGGGSSNASAVLEGLAKLEGIANDETLKGVAAELGSDCPLFLHKAPVVMRGRGELISEISERARTGLKGTKILLFRPSFGVGTAWAYGKLAGQENGYAEREWTETRLSEWEQGRVGLGDLLFNSFERPVFSKYPSLALMKENLEAVGCPTIMSGSGSCCFALCPDEAIEDETRKIIVRDWGNCAFVQSAMLL